MNENLNLVEILDGCPKGTKFYHSVYGEVCLTQISQNALYSVILSVCQDGSMTSVTEDGRLYKGFNGDCVLFPSKDQRDWAKFERFWDKPKVEKFDPKTLQPFDKILVRDYLDEQWSIDFFSHKTGKIVRGLYSNWMYAIPFNEETKCLVGKNEDCSEYYEWWEK